MTTDKIDADILKGLLIATIVLFIGVGISILLSYNDYLKAKEENRLFTDQDAYYILLFDRIVFMGVFIYFSYATYIQLQRREKMQKDTRYISLLLLANIIGVLSGLTSVYATIKYPTSAETGLEEAVL